jgi:hypothetical protein
MDEALLAVLALLPAVLSYLLKSNAALSFLALCGGFAAITISGSDVQHLIGKTKITSLSSNDIDIILLIAPLILTLFFTIRSVTSAKLRLVHLVPALCAGGMLAIIAGPMLSDVVNSDISKLTFWKDLQNLESWIVGAGLMASLLLVWSSGFTHAKSHSHGKKHK